jgi:hypothetical protein
MPAFTKEKFATLLSSWRPNEQISHRLLLLMDSTDRDVDRLPKESTTKDVNREIEYTMTYKSN